MAFRVERDHHLQEIAPGRVVDQAMHVAEFERPAGMGLSSAAAATPARTRSAAAQAAEVAAREMDLRM